MKGLADMNDREKRFLLFGGAAGLVMIVLLATNLLGGPKAKVGTIDKALQEQRELAQGIERYNELQALVGPVDKKIARTPKDYDLFGDLSSMIDSLNLKDSLKTMNPGEKNNTDFYTESNVNIDLQKISLNSLVDLLSKIDASPAFLRVTRLAVKRRFREEGTLDVNMRVAAYAPPEAKTGE